MNPRKIFAVIFDIIVIIALTDIAGKIIYKSVWFSSLIEGTLGQWVLQLFSSHSVESQIFVTVMIALFFALIVSIAFVCAIHIFFKRMRLKKNLGH